ncbi:2-dehydropantoate 2-reductase [Heliobacillus mobilis]|uniref:2-dehydropantoate 2-reductase n=1 Tax=Heliobacterium mobile TaxID=28064 RepID=A0A6I3SH46_HELMO|nr:2-dehydropantoate 2-reductase [Heliobacterium mobile]MTV48173.1 2-dehydropantoate 2-reductase [Heliobacterium mobile]
MRIAVIGMGGVGGFFGGKLAYAFADSKENDVFFIARGDHLKAMQEQGLTVKSSEEKFVAYPTEAVQDPSEIGMVDFVLFCVKTYDLETAAQQIVPLLKRETLVLPLLNGVDHAERLRALLPQGKVLNGCCYIFSKIESPGVISQGGGVPRIVFGADKGVGLPEISQDQLDLLANLFREADISAKFVADAEVAVWSKYLLICSLGGITSFFQKPVGAVASNPEQRAMLLTTMEEVYAVAKAKGVQLDEAIVKKTMASVDTFAPESTTSMQRDFEKGSRTELEAFSGYIVRTGRGLGVPTPAHEKVYEQLKPLSK